MNSFPVTRMEHFSVGDVVRSLLDVLELVLARAGSISLKGFYCVFHESILQEGGGASTIFLKIFSNSQLTSTNHMLCCGDGIRRAAC